MLIFRFLLILYVSKLISTFTSVKIEPESEFYKKSDSLIISCNATEVKANPELIYSYKAMNYTIPEIENSNKFVYIGNLTISEPDQYRVNVLCIKSKFGEFLSSKIYLFGYPPSEVLVGEWKPQLKCQDYNMRRVVCCVSPSEDEMAAKTGLVEENNGHFTISLVNLNYQVTEKKYNNSCYNVTAPVYTTSMYFELRIQNVLGNQSIPIVITRSDILKPERPHLSLKSIGVNNVSLITRLMDDGEFLIIYTCRSENPSVVTKNDTKIVSGDQGQDIKITVGGWKPNSKVYCRIRLQILLGKSGMGRFSEESIAHIQMPEDRPNSGPFISPAFISYHSIYKRKYLQDVVIYLIDVPPVDRNGKIVEYRWECTNCKYMDRDISNNEQKLKGQNNVRLNTAAIGSSISITACTAIGCSNSWTQMRFMKLADRIPNHRVFLTRNPDNDGTMSLVWYLKNETSPNPRYVLLCSKPSDRLPYEENGCSSIKKIELSKESIGTKSLVMDDFVGGKFAFVPSVNGTNISKIHWNNCIYETRSLSVITDKLKDLKNNGFFEFHNKCSWSTCYFDVIIRIPTCEQFSFVVFSGIFITYDSRDGVKKDYRPFLTENEITLQIIGPDLSKTGSFNVSIISSDNETIFWFQHTIDTGWMNISYLIGFICLGLAIAIAIFVFMWKKNREIAELFFRNDYHKSEIHLSSKHNEVKPLDLNNAPNNRRIGQPNGIYRYSPSESPMMGEQTYSTQVDHTDSGSSYDSGNSQNQLIQQDSGDSYIKRPDTKGIEAVYISLGENVNKNNPTTKSDPLM